MDAHEMLARNGHQRLLVLIGELVERCLVHGDHPGRAIEPARNDGLRFHAAIELEHLLALSGSFDLRRFFDAHPADFSDEFYVSSPLHFVPHLGGKHLDVLKTRYIQLTSGEGRAEALWESWAMANVLGRKGIPNKVDSWGPDWPHDWLTWRRMLPQILGEWTKA
jgi:esterase/lipase superfamily enzyme